MASMVLNVASTLKANIRLLFGFQMAHSVVDYGSGWMQYLQHGVPAHSKEDGRDMY